MTTPAEAALKPRKKPVQARSAVTLGAIHEAGIQVLLAGGYARFTTSRVAERAGVSIGSLYQYYPNKGALLAALLHAHLEAVLCAVEAACSAQEGQGLEAMVEGLVTAFLEAKLRRPDISLALYAPMAEAQGATLVRAAAMRGAAAMARLLASCADASFTAPGEAAAILATALSAILQAALEAGPAQLDQGRLRRHLNGLALGYLRALAAEDASAAAIPAAHSPPEPPRATCHSRRR